MPSQAPITEIQMPPAVGLTPVASDAELSLYLVSPHSQASTQLRAFIGERFERAFAARPKIQAPQFLMLTGANHALLAAVGVRSAQHQGLFLEQYLDKPIERYCSPGTARRQLVELVHLAGISPWIAHRFFPMVGQWLGATGSEWVCFTATRPVRMLFRQLGLSATNLGQADPERLSDQQADWGRYYHYRPEVLLAHVPTGLNQLRLPTSVDKKVRKGAQHVECA
jgi:hypothetical protein